MSSFSKFLTTNKKNLLNGDDKITFLMSHFFGFKPTFVSSYLCSLKLKAASNKKTAI